jgi:hypothetical protein
VHRGHINTLEALIQRYQLDLDKTFDGAAHSIELAVNDSGHLAIVLNNLISQFRKLGVSYIQEAADLGYTRALADLKSSGWVRKYQTPVYAPKDSLVEVLRANQDYLQKSLLPDMHKRFSGSRNVRAGINALRSRIALYGHYLWTTAEKSYKNALSTYEKSRATKLKESIRLIEVGGPGSGDKGHEGRKGQVGGSASSASAIAKAAYDAIQKQGGVTISVRGETPKAGFAVAGIGASEKVVEAVTLRDVQDYMRANKAILAEPRRYLGAWVSDGKTYLDTPEIIPDRDEALKTATARGELAIYDLAAGEEISTGVVREAQKLGVQRIIFGHDQSAVQVFAVLKDFIGGVL